LTGPLNTDIHASNKNSISAIHFAHLVEIIVIIVTVLVAVAVVV